MDHADTAAKLVALANDESTSMDERRTAAFTAAQIMGKHLVAPAHKVSRGFSEDFERTHFLARIKGDYVDAATKIYDVLAEQFEHPGETVTGRAELNRLCYALASIAGDIVLGMPTLGQNLAELKSCLPVVVAAFREWDTKQEPADLDAIRAALVESFERQSKQECHLNSIAAALHVPAPDVQSTLERLVEEGFLRRKSGRYERVKRHPKPKVTAPDPRQSKMFGGEAES